MSVSVATGHLYHLVALTSASTDIDFTGLSVWQAHAMRTIRWRPQVLFRDAAFTGMSVWSPRFVGRRLCARPGGAAAGETVFGVAAGAAHGRILLVPRLLLDHRRLLSLRRPPGARPPKMHQLPSL